MIFIILFISLILRIISINQSLWLDEAININNVSQLNLIDLVTKYSLGDFHPPLYHVILKVWFYLFGNSEISIRLPSVIFGVSSVYITFLIAKKLFDNKTALIAATLIATSPLHIYYSQEARMYMMATFLSSLSLYFFISIIKSDKIYNWFGFIIATSLTLYTDYLPYFILPVYLFYLVLFRKHIKKQTLYSFIPSFVLILLFISPWFSVFYNQFKVGLATATAAPVWAEVVGSPSSKSFLLTFVKIIIGRISIDNNFIYLMVLIPIGLIFGNILLLSAFRLSIKRTLLWFYFLGPILLAFAFSFYVPIFSYFRFTFVIVSFYILLASGIMTVNWISLNRFLLSLVLIVNLSASTIYLTNSKFHREDWKNAVHYIFKNNDANTIVLFESGFTMAPFDYYAKNKQINSFGVMNNFNPTKEEVSFKINQLTINKNKVYLFQYLSEISDPNGYAYQTLTQNNYINTSTTDFRGVGLIYEFKR